MEYTSKWACIHALLVEFVFIVMLVAAGSLACIALGRGPLKPHTIPRIMEWQNCLTSITV